MSSSRAEKVVELYPPPAAGELRLVTVGNPNTGKTTLVNALSGSRLRIGNWAGTTVDRVETSFSVEGRAVRLVDLPGAYSLAATSAEEGLTRDELLAAPPDGVINVLDAGNLERNLYLTLELGELGYPMTLALNLVDEARAKGLSPDAGALAARLGVPVVATVAVKEQGMDELVRTAIDSHPSNCRVRYPEHVEQAAAVLEAAIPHTARRWIALAALSGEPMALEPQTQATADRLREGLLAEGHDPFLEIADARYRMAREIAASVQPVRATGHRLTDVLDRLVLHPWLGIPMFLLGMLLVFRFTFLFSDPWVECLGVVQSVLAGWVASMALPDLVRSFVSDGLIGGIGTVLAFTPVLFFLYLALSFMEASGFLSRAAFLVDRLMKMMGLPGKGFIPLVLGFGCNVPAISATRTLESFSERLRVSLAVPFAACSARLTVFTLFTAVFFPKNAAFVVFGLYLLGLAIGLLTALVMGRLTPREELGSAMELPPYRIPTLKVVWRQATSRTMKFVRGAGGSILIAVVAVWVLLNIPQGDLANSLYAKVSTALAWCLAPLGIHDWRLAGALIPGFIAKEVVVGTLGVSFLGSDAVAPMGMLEGFRQMGAAFGQAVGSTLQAFPALVGLPEFTPPPPDAPDGLTAALAQSTTPGGALAYMVFILLYTPCVATLAALKMEFGKGWAWFSAIYQLVVAYGLAFVAGRLL